MGTAFIAQTPPDDKDELNEYIQRMFRGVAESVESIIDGRILDIRNSAPPKPRDAMVVYADGTNWDPGKGEGIYAYINGAWVFLSDQKLTTEEVQDIAGALIATGGTKTGISITYQDSTNDMDFAVSNPTVVVGNTTFDSTSATATNIVVTGLGGRPISLDVLWAHTASAFEGGVGFSDGTNDAGFQADAGNISLSTTSLFTYDIGFAGTDGQVIVVNSFDSDGFTLGNTKVGSPTGTLSIAYKCVLEY